MLEVFFKIPSKFVRASFDKFRQFAEDHLSRLASENPEGDLSQMIADTQSAYQAYFGKLSDEKLAETVRKSQTKAKNGALKAFRKAVSRKEGLVRSEFDVGTPEYLDFFPRGKSEYSRANLSNAEILMNQFIAAAGKHAEVLGTKLKTDFEGLRANFIAARDMQMAQKGAVAETEEERDAARVTLEDQLHDNLLALARRHKRKPEMAARFANESLLG